MLSAEWRKIARQVPLPRAAWRVMTWIMFHRKFLLPASPPVAKMTPAPFIDRYPWSKP